MKKIFLSLGCLTAVLLLLFSPLPAAAADTAWEGTASMSRFGEFPVTGFYGASNSFPRNTIVRIQNVANGKETTVIIADRLPNSSLFILLSREAAMALDIPQDEVTSVKVAVQEAAPSLGVTGAQPSAGSQPVEKPFSSDPERNPLAGSASAGAVLPPEEPVIAAVAPVEPVTAPVEIPESPDASHIASGPVTAEGPILIPMMLPAVPEEPPVPETVPVVETPPAEETVTASSLSGSPAEGQEILIVPETPPVVGEKPVAAQVDASPELPEAFALETVVMPEEPGEEVVGGGEGEGPSVSEIGASPESVSMAIPSLLTAPEEPAEGAPEAGAPDIPVPVEVAALAPAAFLPVLPGMMEPEIQEPAAAGEPVEVAGPVEEPPVEEGPFVTELGGEAPADGASTIALATVLPEISEETQPDSPDRPAAADMEAINPVPAEDPVLALADVPPEGGPSITEFTNGNAPAAVEEPAAEIAVTALPAVTEEAAGTAALVETPVLEETGPVIAESETVPPTVPEPGTADLSLMPAEPRPPLDLSPLAAEEVSPSLGEGKASAALALAENPARPELPPEKAAGVTVTEESHPSPAETALVLEPSVMKPPEPAAEVQPAAGKQPVETKTDIRIALADKLQKGSYYLQLGVYAEADSAKRLADRYSPSFPVSIYKPDGDKFYKVLLGPVNEDETGSLLYNFKAKGFKDAFIRQEK